MKPKRIQRQRVKGWKNPPNTIYVGRPSKWGNPFKIDGRTREDAIELFSKLPSEYFSDLNLSKLKGKNLSCWCPIGSPCHADVLLKLANEN